MVIQFAKFFYNKTCLGTDESIICSVCDTVTSNAQKLPINRALYDSLLPTSRLTCEVHNKDSEAFYVKQKLLVCVKCILEKKLKTEELISIEEAVVNEKQNLLKTKSKLRSHEELVERFSELDMIADQTSNHYVSQKTLLETKFQEIIEFVTSKRNLKFKVLKENYDFNQEEIKNERSNLEAHADFAVKLKNVDFETIPENEILMLSQKNAFLQPPKTLKLDCIEFQTDELVSETLSTLVHAFKADKTANSKVQSKTLKKKNSLPAKPTTGKKLIADNDLSRS